MDMKDDNKNIQMLKKELWTRQQIIANIKMIQKKQVVEETTLLEEIWQNGTREHKLMKEIEKQDRKA